MRVYAEVQVDVDPYEALADLSTDDLAEVLASRRANEKNKPSEPADPIEVLIESIDRVALDEALWHWHANRTEDALWFLEKALGKKWSGLSDVLLRRAA